jgi:hypothetical protein
MNTSVEKNFQCSVCYENFDEAEKRPRILHKCGHTLCQQCLHKVIELAPNDSSIQTTSCPICSTKSNFTTESWEKDFQINYALEDAIKVIVELNQKVRKTSDSICLIHTLPIDQICMNPKCTQIPWNCFRCRLDNHSECPLPYLFNIQEAQRNVTSVDSFNFANYQKSVIEVIQKFRESFVNNIDKIFEDFKIRIFGSANLMDINQYISNKNDYSLGFLNGGKTLQITKNPSAKTIFKSTELLYSRNIEAMFIKALNKENFAILQTTMNDYLDPFKP